MKKPGLASSVRVFLWGIRLYLARNKKPLLILLLLVFVLWLLFNKQPVKMPVQTSTFKVGFVAQVISPTELPLPITRLLSSGLTALTKDGDAVADLVQKWEQNDKGTLFTFYLKPNLVWQDGTKVISSEIKFDLADVSLSYPAEDQIVFELKNPFSPLPVLLIKPVFKENTFLGTGPCRVIRVDKREETISRLTISCSNQDSLLDLRFYPTKEDAWVALELGEIKALWSLRSKDKEETLPNFDIYPQESYGRFIAVFFNLNDPFLGEKEARQALTMAIPKENFPRRAFGPISPSSWAYSPDLKKYDFDLKEAKTLLEERELPSSLQLWTTPIYQNLAQEIASSWEKLGIPTQIEVKTGDESSLKGFQALLIGQEIPPDPDQYSLWHSTQETNITGLKSPKIDKYLEDGRAVFSQEERKTIYQDFQKYLVEECPAAFLYYPEEYVLVSQKIDTPVFREIFGVEAP